MTTEQEIIDQITFTEAALEKSEAEVHKAVAEQDEARLARSGKSTDPELKDLDARIGLHSRFNVNDPILFRSHTVFDSVKATISDTTDQEI